MMAARKVQMPFPGLVSQIPLSSGKLATTSARLFTVNDGGFAGGDSGRMLEARVGGTNCIARECDPIFVAKEGETCKAIAASSAVTIKSAIATRRVKPFPSRIIISSRLRFAVY